MAPRLIFLIILLSIRNLPAEAAARQIYRETQQALQDGNQDEAYKLNLRLMKDRTPPVSSFIGATRI